MADSSHPSHAGDGETRRDFLYLMAGAMTVAGGALAVWPLIDSMNPSAEVLALSTTEVDLSPIEVGMAITVIWRGEPVFIRRRTADEIKIARGVALDELPDPQADEDRVQKPEWLVMVGVCTHLGCIPKGQKSGESKGE